MRIAGDRIGDGVLDYFDAHQRVLAERLRLHGDKRHQCSCKYKHRHRYNWSTSKFLNPWPAGQKCPARRLNVAREPTSASTIFKARFKGPISFRDAVNFSHCRLPSSNKVISSRLQPFSLECLGTAVRSRPHHRRLQFYSLVYIHESGSPRNRSKKRIISCFLDVNDFFLQLIPKLVTQRLHLLNFVQ